MSQLPLITSVFLNVTDSCNLRCPYCFVEQKPNYMNYQTAKDTADFLIRNAEKDGSIPAINFFGGEPTLCWDSIIVPLTNYIRQEYGKPFELSMTSNCTLLTEEHIKFLQENDVGLLFSIDGDKNTQNINRPKQNGKGSFPLLEDKIDLISKSFPNVCFRSTLIPKTCQNLFHNIHFAHRHGYKHYFVVPNVFEEWDEEARATVQKEMRRFSDWVIQSFRKGKGMPIRFSDFEESFVKIQRINTAIVNNLFREEGRCGACAKCGLGSMRYGAVDWRGNVYACQELVSPKGGSDNHFYIGSIYSGIDDNRRKILMSSFEAKANRTGKCEHCRLNRICNGGCVANNYMILGNVNSVPEVYCWWMNLLLDEAIYVSTELGGEQNQGFLEYWGMIHNGGRF